jgi:hypothetical protein
LNQGLNQWFPPFFEGMDNSVSRKATVANVLPLLYAKLLGSCKKTTVSVGGGCIRGCDDNKPFFTWKFVI